MWRPSHGSPRRLPATCALAATLLGCSGSSGSANATAQTPKAAAETLGEQPTTAVDDCPTFRVERTGVCQDDALSETSGIAASTTLPGALWAHNDSGDEPRLFAVGRDGQLHGQVRLVGASAVDWEDMSAAPGRAGSARDLVVGDVGDNFAGRDTVQLYRLPEPALTDLGGDVTVTRYDVRFASGPKDVESLFVDPRDGVVYLVTKRLFGSARVFRVALPDTPSGTLVAEPVTDVPVPLATAADMSADGSRFIVRNYRRAYLWNRGPHESVREMLSRPPCPVELPDEPQGEAIAFADSHTLLLLSEQLHQPIYVLKERGVDALVTPP